MLEPYLILLYLTTLLLELGIIASQIVARFKVK
jgi:hypothetical protein